MARFKSRHAAAAQFPPCSFYGYRCGGNDYGDKGSAIHGTIFLFPSFPFLSIRRVIIFSYLHLFILAIQCPIGSHGQRPLNRE